MTSPFNQQELTMQYYLEMTSNSFSGKSCIPLDVGRWTLKNGAWVLDKSFKEFELCDALYEVAFVDGDNEDSPHYCAVMNALAPIFSRQQTALSCRTVDEIFYAFEVKTSEA
jgi:hypothetical protein